MILILSTSFGNLQAQALRVEAPRLPTSERTVQKAVGSLLAEPPELRKGLATQEQESCLVEVRRKATLGKLEDPISVEIPFHASIAEVPWGGWVVAEDRKDVIEYSADGGFRRTLGRRGEGPGELRAPNVVIVDPTDSTWVSDRRGRAVIFGPDGSPGRTLISTHLYDIDGFTESGLPYSSAVRMGESVRSPAGTKRFFQIWSRDGEPLFQLGPGRFLPGSEGYTTNAAPQSQSVVVGDSMAVVPTVPGEGWLTFWTASREWAAVPQDSIWRTLGIEGRPRSHSDGRSIAVSSDSTGGYWVLGAVRRLSEKQEDALIENTEPPRNQRFLEVYRRMAAPVTNAVFDGAIIHVTADGRITGGTSFEDMPRGFASPSQFYTFTEGEYGLIQIHIWEFKRNCSVTGGQS